MADTNVLLRSIEPHHPMQAIAADSLQLLGQQGESIFLVPLARCGRMVGASYITQGARRSGQMLSQLVKIAMHSSKLNEEER